jgi:hypothetical protein
MAETDRLFLEHVQSFRLAIFVQNVRGAPQ